MVSLIEQAWRALRTDASGPPDRWRALYEQGLRAAYAEQRVAEGAELAVFAAVCLEAQGLYEDAVAQLDYALALSRSEPTVQARLLCVRAGCEALVGSEHATRSLAEAEAALRGVENLQCQVELAVYRALVASVQLTADSVELAKTATHAAESNQFDWISGGLKPWAVATMFAASQRRAAQPWLTSLRIQAEVAENAYRLAGVAAIEYANRATGGAPAFDPTPFEAAPRNTWARWRASTTRLHVALVTNRRDEAGAALEALEALNGQLSPGHTDGLPLFRAIHAAWFEEGERLEAPAPPDHVALTNLPAVIAGLEAVALAGRQHDALVWSRWAEEVIPPHIQTSMEWPTSLTRVRALLKARTGDPLAAIKLAREAVRWADEAGYAVEAGRARIQLAELVALGSKATSESRWMRDRRQGRDALLALGISPTPHAYAATRAIALGRSIEYDPNLTPREIEVLKMLAQGLSYKEMGKRLGISWRTAQVHASHIYEKLGVSGKMMATQRGRELGII